MIAGAPLWRMRAAVRRAAARVGFAAAEVGQPPDRAKPTQLICHTGSVGDVASPILGFPNPVNEKAARTVAAGVAMLTVLTLATQWWWFSAVLAAGFLARVLTGPRLSPLGQLATRVVAPRLGAPKEVPGPPKRFAQAIGFVVTGSAAIAWFGFGSGGWTAALLTVLLVFALLESVLGFCAGCWLFAQLMRAGIIPASTCAACADIWSRRPRSA